YSQNVRAAPRVDSRSKVSKRVAKALPSIVCTSILWKGTRSVQNSLRRYSRFGASHGLFRLAHLPLLFAAGFSIAQPKGEPRLTLQFSHTHGFYHAPFDVSLATQIPNASIYYTTNGMIPTRASGRLYERPVKVQFTTTLRAVAIEIDLAITPIKTETYIFPADVLKQTGGGFPKTWGTNQGKAVPADYEMDPKIVNHPDYRGMVEGALESIPTLSIVMEPDDLFGPQHGIYPHSQETGSEWERAASAELIYPDGRIGFDVNCGIRIQGGWNRRPEESPKHAFRLVFKKKYGPATLQFPLFGEGVQEFDT